MYSDQSRTCSSFPVSLHMDLFAVRTCIHTLL